MPKPHAESMISFTGRPAEFCSCVLRSAVDARDAEVFGPAMKPISTPLPARPFALANLLTYARIIAVPAVVGALFCQAVLQGPLWLRWVSLAIFLVAAITDALDGYVARAWEQQSSFGRMLDPIAD